MHVRGSGLCRGEQGETESELHPSFIFGWDEVKNLDEPAA